MIFSSFFTPTLPSVVIKSQAGTVLPNLFCFVRTPKKRDCVCFRLVIYVCSLSMAFLLLGFSVVSEGMKKGPAGEFSPCCQKKNFNAKILIEVSKQLQKVSKLKIKDMVLGMDLSDYNMSHMTNNIVLRCCPNSVFQKKSQ